MRRDIIVENCPGCGRTHRYLLEVSQADVRETDRASLPVSRNRLFTCPNTGEIFQHRFSLDAAPGTRILEVSTQGLLADAEEVAQAQPAASPPGDGNRSFYPSADRREQEIRVFISYSRSDQLIVTPIVQILRAVGLGVFHDVDSIPFGKRWRPVIEDSIERATVMVVFWCEHARSSVEVRKEWELAVRSGKDVVPMFLDDTPLERDLAEFQAVDLRPLTSVHRGAPVEGPGMFPELTDTHHAAALIPETSAAVAARLLEFLDRRMATQT